MVSDVDEIIAPSTVQFIRENDGYFMLDMPMYQFYMNMRALPSGWTKAFAYSWHMDPEIGDYNWIRGHELQSFERFPTRHRRIERAGWHFTFLGGADAVRTKLGSYSHSERWQRTMLQAGQVERQLAALKDVGGGRFLEFCRVDETFPETLREFRIHYAKAGLLKDIHERVRELEGEAAHMDREKRTIEARLRYQEAELDRGKVMSFFATNLALNKSATQSSICAWSLGRTREEDARGGNNGTISGSYGFHTEKEQDPWWQVDLEEVFEVQEIRVYNRLDNTAGRLRHFSLLRSLNGADWEIFLQKTDDSIFDTEPFVWLCYRMLAQ
jgi:F5/8 type C domain